MTRSMAPSTAFLFSSSGPSICDEVSESTSIIDRLRDQIRDEISTWISLISNRIVSVDNGSNGLSFTVPMKETRSSSVRQHWKKLLIGPRPQSAVQPIGVPRSSRGQRLQSTPERPRTSIRTDRVSRGFAEGGEASSSGIRPIAT